VPLTATVKAPTVGDAFDGAGVGVVVAVGVGTAVSLGGVAGDFEADGVGAAFAGVAFELGLAVGCPVEPAVVAAAVVAEANALAAAESAGAEAVTPGDETAALGSVLDAAADAGPDDAALL